MALNLKNPEVEHLAEEVARLAGESKTEAIRRALLERKQVLLWQQGGEARGERLRRFLEQEAWPQVPKGELGRRLSKEEEETILGYGPEGA